MEVFVDGDACPRIQMIEEICQEYQVELTVLTDTNHIIDLAYGKRIIVDKQRDGVDYALVNLIHSGDLVITQDYGLASMCLARQALILHPKGFEYTRDNIDELLFTRFIGAKVRHSSKKKHLSGPAKRTKEDDERLEKSIRKIILANK